MDANEAQKYRWIKESLPKGTELVFVFDDPKKPVHFQKKRKDGSRMTHGEWAQKQGFRFFTIDSFMETISGKSE